MPKANSEFDEILKEKQALEKSARLNSLHWLVILGSLALTFGAWSYAKTQAHEKIEIQFLRESDQAVELIEERLKKYEDALWAGVATIHSQSHGIDYEEWARFSDTLDINHRYSGINGIGVIYHAKDEAAKDALISEERKARPDFRVFPEHEKSEYFPITYIEPYNLNKEAVGLDMAHEKNRYGAALKARDTGKAQITGPITLVQDSKKTPGFLFYAPFYDQKNYSTIEERQQNFIGMVYAPFIVQKLMMGTLEKTKRRVGVQISDGENILFNEHLESYQDYDPNPLFKKEYTLNIYGRTWVFDIWSTKSFKDSSNTDKPILILIGGIIFDAFLLAFFLFMSRSNERALRFANKMTDGYQQKNKDLEQLIEKLMDSNQELERFAYVAAHDMQEPLRMTANFSELLEKEHKTQLDEQGQTFLKYCREGSERLKEILDDLLEYSRIENTDGKVEDCDLNVILEKALDNLRDKIETSDAKIHSDHLPTIRCNPVRFSRLLQNLIENGLKYQKDGNKPVIEILVEEKQENWLFSIKDNGIGIKKEYQEKIFEPFKRLHSNSEYQGTGIGLAICAKIVDKMNGKLRVESDEGAYSTFYIKIPKS